MTNTHGKNSAYISQMDRLIKQPQRMSAADFKKTETPRIPEQEMIDVGVEAFIAARQPFCNAKLKKLSHVTKKHGGMKNRAFTNAIDTAIASNRMQKGIRCQSGWLVQYHGGENPFHTFIQHWWNSDMADNHFDNTPVGEKLSSYVLDFDIYQYGSDNFHYIKSNVACSLLLQNGVFSMLYDAGRMHFIELSELRTELLFK